LFPGRRTPNIQSSRPPGLERLFRGKPAQLLPDMLAMVFSLCGHAHRLTARRAIEAARGWTPPLTSAEAELLQWQTAREQIRRITWDWPTLLAPALDVRRAPPQALFPPLNDSTPSLATLAAWAEQEVFAMPAERWSERFQGRGTAWLSEWAAGTLTPTAQILQACAASAQQISIAAQPLRLQRDDAAQFRLARLLSASAADAFVRAPEQADGYAETGAWTRHLDPLSGTYRDLWGRMGSRLLDLAKLSQPNYGASWLCCGAVKTGPSEGLAWTETARGLLVHWVALDGAAVGDCRVLAPTDWNFHPDGIVARALAFQPPGPQGRAGTDAILSVFDPCLAFDVITQTEKAHA